MEKYHFRKYDKKFPKLFQVEKARLKKIIVSAKIEHVGSTAVQGLRGKGVIDIAVSVNKKDIHKVKNKLIKGKYVFLPRAGEKDRLFFERDYNYNGKTRRVHVHLTNQKSNIWKSMMAVRDYLREHPEEIDKYEKIKREGVKTCKGKGKIYRKHKNKYLNNLTKKALKNDN